MTDICFFSLRAFILWSFSLILGLQHGLVCGVADCSTHSRPSISTDWMNVPGR